MLSAILRTTFVLLLPVLAFPQSPDGQWVGKLDYGQYDLPFNFEVESERFTIINGEERIDQKIILQGDSFRVDMKPFDSFLHGTFVNSELIGKWEKPYRGTVVDFSAQRGDKRYMANRKSGSLPQKMSVTFEPGSDAYPGVALFKENSPLQATIQTETGDFRYFQGIVDGDSLKMSCFDGAHGFMMVGKRQGKKWNGKFYFDPNYIEDWEAVPDENASIADPFEMKDFEVGEEQPYFDLLGGGSGKNSIDEGKYVDKVLIIQVFGTWCPNSLDQTHFLLDWYKDKPEDVEVLAVTYEPNYSKEYGLKRINEYTSHLQIPYDVVLGGPLSKSKAALPFPFMKKIQAFPTLVILDKQGFVRYVHSYFNGPATGEKFQEFKKEFSEKIDLLVGE